MNILMHADASTADLVEMSNTSQCTEFLHLIHENLRSYNNSIDSMHIQGLLLSQ